MTRSASAMSAMRRRTCFGKSRDLVPQKWRRPDPKAGATATKRATIPIPEPLTHAAPEKDGRRLGLYVREQRRSGGREAAHRLERGVEQAAECPFQQERDPAEQRREHPHRSHREVHVAVGDLPNASPRGGRVTKTPVPPSATTPPR